MEYKYLTQDRQDDIAAEALLMREEEHYQYEINRINYGKMLDAMSHVPKECPDHLKRFLGLPGHEFYKHLPDEKEFKLVAQIQYRDHIKMMLATTEMEQSKVEGIYNALASALPEGERRDAAIKRAQAKQAKQANN